jgi:hypothetical protein
MKSAQNAGEQARNHQVIRSDGTLSLLGLALWFPGSKWSWTSVWHAAEIATSAVFGTGTARRFLGSFVAVASFFSDCRKMHPVGETTIMCCLISAPGISLVMIALPSEHLVTF